jgi:hypothetical protein
MTELQDREQEFHITEDSNASWKIVLQRWGFNKPQIVVLFETLEALPTDPAPWKLPPPKRALDGESYFSW